jgi:2-amino-4-hydroxy-6-hydroxymethyldihydropteridine diphosphokinase
MIVAFGLGSNLAYPEKNIETAITYLSELGQLVARSKIYKSKPWGVLEQPDFCNAAILLQCDLAPRPLLNAVKEIESKMGRQPTYTWGPRLIDIDILTMDNLEINEPDLTIPHPQMLKRAFVLVPLTEIDTSYQRHLDALPEEDLSQVWPVLSQGDK